MTKKETILEIAEFAEETDADPGRFWYDEKMRGYMLLTDKAHYICTITSNRQCCEDFGFLSTPDNFDDFIGAELLSYEVIKITGTESEIDEEEKLEFRTSKGILQFSVYQYHNGYYTHGVLIQRRENLRK